MAAGIAGRSRCPSPQQYVPVLPGRSRSIQRPDWLYSPSSEFWICSSVSCQLNRPRTSQMAPCGTKDRFYSQLPPNVQMSLSHPTEESHSFTHYPKLMNIGKSWNVDSTENWELCHLAQLPLPFKRSSTISTLLLHQAATTTGNNDLLTTAPTSNLNNGGFEHGTLMDSMSPASHGMHEKFLRRL